MIVYCASDLIFATKIRSTAESLEIVTRPVRNRDMLAARLDEIDDGKPNDPVTAVIIDLDTGQSGLELIQQAKSHNPTLRVIAFGSHVETDMLQAAQDAGADQVLPRGAFTAQLPTILQTCAAL